MPRLLAELEAAFPAATIYTPADHGARGAFDWPSMDELADAGKRVVVASAADYGEVGPACLPDWLLRCCVLLLQLTASQDNAMLA